MERHKGLVALHAHLMEHMGMELFVSGGRCFFVGLKE